MFHSGWFLCICDNDKDDDDGDFDDDFDDFDNEDKYYSDAGGNMEAILLILLV